MIPSQERAIRLTTVGRGLCGADLRKRELPHEALVVDGEHLGGDLVVADEPSVALVVDPEGARNGDPSGEHEVPGRLLVSLAPDAGDQRERDACRRDVPDLWGRSVLADQLSGWWHEGDVGVVAVLLADQGPLQVGDFLLQLDLADSLEEGVLNAVCQTAPNI